MVSQVCRFRNALRPPLVGAWLLAGLAVSCACGQGDEPPPLAPPAPPAGGDTPPPGGLPTWNRDTTPRRPPGVRPAPRATPPGPVAPVAASLPAAAPAPAAPRDKLRDPFWPFDYVRPVQPGEVLDTDAEIRRRETEWRTVEKLRDAAVKGVSRLPAKDGTEELLAMIGGKFRKIGETVTVTSNGKTYRWTVTGITLKGGPTFERVLATPPAPAGK